MNSDTCSQILFTHRQIWPIGKTKHKKIYPPGSHEFTQHNKQVKK